MVVGEHAVKAAQNAIRTTNWEYGITDADMAKALTAALPFLSGQAAGVSADARQALDRFSFAAQQWGWQADQGSNDAIINDAKAEFDASYAALERILSALEPSAARDLALEEGYRQGIEAAAQKAAEMLVFADTTSTADREIPAAIRAIGTSREQLNKAVSNVPDQQKNELGAHGERVRVLVDALEVAKNELQAWIKCADENGLCVTSTPHVIDHIDIALASLSSPDHADAGKVEGDGCKSEREKYLEEVLRPFSEIAGELFAANFNNDDVVFKLHRKTANGSKLSYQMTAKAFFEARFALPSAPASEGAE